MRSLRLSAYFLLSLALHAGAGGLMGIVDSARSDTVLPPDVWAGRSLVVVEWTPLPPIKSSPELAADPLAPRAGQARPKTATAASNEPAATAPAATKSVSATSAASATEPASTTPPSTAAASTAVPSASEPPGGQDLPPGVRALPPAVTRALPKAAEFDRIWFRLPLGPLGEARIRFVTGDDGRLISTEILDLPAPPEHLKNLLERTFLFLKHGRFAVDPARLSAGTQTLRIRGTLTQRRGNDNELAEPEHTFVLHQEAPTRSRPGRAYVTFNSGRHVEFSIEVE